MAIVGIVGRDGPPEIAQQIARIGEGDPAAKEWLYRSFSPSLYRRIRSRYARDRRLDPEELLHDLFVWCYRDDGAVLQHFVERNTTEQQTHFRLEGYLWGLVSGLVSNRRRGLDRTPEHIHSDDYAGALTEDPEAEQIRRDLLAELSACLKRNGSRVYLYFTLRYVEGLSPQEISNAVGWSRPFAYRLRTKLNAAFRRCTELLGLA